MQCLYQCEKNTKGEMDTACSYLEIRKAYKILIGKHEGRRLFVRLFLPRFELLSRVLTMSLVGLRRLACALLSSYRNIQTPSKELEEVGHKQIVCAFQSNYHKIAVYGYGLDPASARQRPGRTLVSKVNNLRAS